MSQVLDIARNELVACGLDAVSAELAALCMLGALEARGFRLSPAAPTRGMVSASMAAMGPRAGRPWVNSTRVKHRLRLEAALAAAPDWRPQP